LLILCRTVLDGFQVIELILQFPELFLELGILFFELVDYQHLDVLSGQGETITDTIE